MPTYEIIANKFRPQQFSDVMEHTSIVQTLQNAISLNTISNAYLFCGTKGTGKTTLARLFAKSLNCLTKTTNHEPCSTCESCVAIHNGSSLDVIEIDGASNRGIDDVRSINDTVGYAPSLGKYKIYLIDEVHMLTKEAFNALLKTLEEPPSHVVFLFATTEPHKILPTIISRCQRFDLRRITDHNMSKKLTKIAATLDIDIEPKALHLITSHSEGSLRDAESLLDQLICYKAPPITTDHVIELLGIIPYQLFFSLDHAVKTHAMKDAFAITHQIYQSGHHLENILEQLASHFRTTALVKINNTQPPSPEYTTSANIYESHQLIHILDYLIDATEKFRTKPFHRIHLEVIFLYIINHCNQISLEELVHRLEQLQETSTPQPLQPPSPKPVASQPLRPPSPKPVASQPLQPPSPKPVASQPPLQPPSPKPVASQPPLQPPSPKPVASQPPLQPPSPKPVASQPLQPLKQTLPEVLNIDTSYAKTDKQPSSSQKIQEKIRHEQILRFTSVCLKGKLK